LFDYQVLQTAQRCAINIRPFRKPQLRAKGRIEHPPRNFNEHRIEWCARQFAEVRHIGVGAASPARQNITTIPGVPRITELPGLKRDTVGFL
jgi:hypothetical protein